MTTYWKTIIQSRYDDKAVSEDVVKSFVPRKITQEECNAIIGVK